MDLGGSARLFHEIDKCGQFAAWEQPELGHTYTFTRQPDGTTDIDVDVVREGKNLKGRVIGLVLGTVGKSVLEKAFEGSVKAIEARNGAAREGGGGAS